jgi:protein-arginine kinase activator protein McsA
MVPRRYVIDGEEVDRSEVRFLLSSGRLNELFTALLMYQPKGGVCPHCGVTEADIDASGLVGCPLCYTVHEAYLLRTFGATATQPS